MSTDSHGKGRPNWVKERAECTLRFAFEQLCKEIQDDLEAMEPYPDIVVHDCKNVRVERENNKFRVQCDSQLWDKTVTLIRVYLGTDKIRIWSCDAEGKPQETGLRPQWNVEQDCCELLYDGLPLAYWEVSKRVLEPLFFDER